MNMVDDGVIDPQTGFGPITWDSWETNWTGIDIVESTRTRVIQNGPDQIHRQGPGGRSRVSVRTRQVTDSVTEERIQTGTMTGTRSRNGVRTIVTEQFDRESVGDRVVSRDLIPFMRSRNVEFVSKKVKPLTRLYPFFDGVDVSKYCVPKLLEITMVSGTFEVGETVVGLTEVVGDIGSNTLPSSPFIRFRVAQSNHREGPYDAPTKTFRQNPYNSQDLSAAYSSTATVLNVDTFLFLMNLQGQYYGWVRSGMTLRGQSSGAIASVSNVRLVSDISATLIGSYYIPDPNNASFPRFETGTKTFTLTDNIDNNQDQAVTIAEEGFASTGTLETFKKISSLSEMQELK